MTPDLKAPEGKKYDPCGGCGADHPSKACIGCHHPFALLNGHGEKPPTLLKCTRCRKTSTVDPGKLICPQCGEDYSGGSETPITDAAVKRFQLFIDSNGEEGEAVSFIALCRKLETSLSAARAEVERLTFDQKTLRTQLHNAKALNATLREENRRLRDGIHDASITIRETDGGFEVVRDGKMIWSTSLESAIMQSFPAAPESKGGEDG